MDIILQKLNKLSLPAVILIASIILGGFFYASQISKQRSIEKQQQIKIEQEKQEWLVEQEAKKQSEQMQREKENLVKIQLNTCLTKARDDYDSIVNAFIKALNEGEFKNVSNTELLFDEAKKDLETEKTECFKRYPQQ